MLTSLSFESIKAIIYYFFQLSNCLFLGQLPAILYIFRHLLPDSPRSARFLELLMNMQTCTFRYTAFVYFSLAIGVFCTHSGLLFPEEMLFSLALGSFEHITTFGIFLAQVAIYAFDTPAGGLTQILLQVGAVLYIFGTSSSISSRLASLNRAVQSDCDSPGTFVVRLAELTKIQPTQAGFWGFMVVIMGSIAVLAFLLYAYQDQIVRALSNFFGFPIQMRGVLYLICFPMLARFLYLLTKDLLRNRRLAQELVGSQHDYGRWTVPQVVIIMAMTPLLKSLSDTILGKFDILVAKMLWQTNTNYGLEFLSQTDVRVKSW
jgi:hypothetical protein